MIDLKDSRWKQVEGMEIWHWMGRSWPEHPVPSRWHACKAATVGILGMTEDGKPRYVYRCPCGAISDTNQDWYGRNSRNETRRQWYKEHVKRTPWWRRWW